MATAQKKVPAQKKAAPRTAQQKARTAVAQAAQSLKKDESMSPILSVYDRTDGSRKKLVLEKTEVDAVLTHLVQSRGLVPSSGRIPVTDECLGTIPVMDIPRNVANGEMKKPTITSLEERIIEQRRSLFRLAEQLYYTEESLALVIGERPPDILPEYEIFPDNRLNSMMNSIDFTDQLTKRLARVAELAKGVL